MSYQEILVERRGQVAVITLNRPERLNPLSWNSLGELHSAFTELEPDDDVRAIVLTGAGRAFSAGADLTSPSPITVPTEKEPRYLLYLPHLMATCFKPTIAAINGQTVAGGISICLACDIRIASAFATFSSAYIHRAMIPTFAISFFLPLVVGPGRALEILYTGEVIDAQEALRIGLVHRVVPHEDLMPAALALAERLAQGPPLALGYTKRLAYQALGLKMAAQAEDEDVAERLVKRTQDFQEGLRSFMEKREPRFPGQ